MTREEKIEQAIIEFKQSGVEAVQELIEEFGPDPTVLQFFVFMRPKLDWAREAYRVATENAKDD